MLFCDQFDNFEDFKSRFGFKTGIDGRYLVNANGVKQRKNNIVYLYWKESCIHFRKQGYDLKEAYRRAVKFDDAKSVFREMLNQVFGKDISDICPVKSFGEYEILNSGICFDGDVSSIRYRHAGKTYKMKIGKYVGKYLEYVQKHGRAPFWLNNPTLHIFFMEELTELWKNKRLKDKTLHVVVDKDFHAIYDVRRRPSDSNHFGSCMDGDTNWNYYKDHSDIYDAVSLQDDEGLIYARAILVHCFDDNGKEYKYLERIYCNKRMYKDFMFEKAKAEKVFDLFKGLEASCHDNLEIYDVNTGNRISFCLYIPLELHNGDYMSYQDTFKWWYKSANKAYNIQKEGMGHSKPLTTTDVHVSVND